MWTPEVPRDEDAAPPHLHHPENYVLWDVDRVERVSFIVHGEPVAQGSKRVFRTPQGKINTTDQSPKLKPWRQEIVGVIEAYDLAVRLSGPVQVDLDFYFSRLKGHYGTGRNADVLKANAPDYVAVRPDADKLARAALDAITMGGLIMDDAAVAVLTVTKRYAERPGMRVTVRRLA